MKIISISGDYSIYSQYVLFSGKIKLINVATKIVVAEKGRKPPMPRGFPGKPNLIYKKFIKIFEWGKNCRNYDLSSLVFACTKVKGFTPCVKKINKRHSFILFFIYFHNFLLGAFYLHRVIYMHKGMEQKLKLIGFK